MKKIFCISGLGADEKVFNKLDLPGFDPVFLKWPMPEKNEPIQLYAEKMISQITEVEPILLGLSFGGIMCLEISRIIKVKSVIIISSIIAPQQLPYWMKLVSKMNLHKIIKPYPYKILAPFQNYNLGVTEAEEIEMVTNYRKNINLDYLKWAVNAILNWNFTHPLPHYFHIHGTHDRIFPLKDVKPHFIVKGGGHLMIYNKSAIVNHAIVNFLNQKDNC